MLDILLSQTISGLVLGGLYVLIAIGLSIIFGLLGIVNFGHGAFFTLGAYLAVTLVQYFGWPAVVLSPVIVYATTLMGLIIVVGSGGVGKTTLAASLGVVSAREGRDTLVMTFDKVGSDGNESRGAMVVLP